MRKDKRERNEKFEYKRGIWVQSAKTACAAALENAEGVREALKAKNVLEAAQKSSTAAYRAHSVRTPP